jgi:hypothetical protein
MVNVLASTNVSSTPLALLALTYLALLKATETYKVYATVPLPNFPLYPLIPSIIQREQSGAQAVALPWAGGVSFLCSVHRLDFIRR